MRPTDVPDTGLLCDLLWSDPDKDIQGWAESERGVSYVFGSDIINIFLPMMLSVGYNPQSSLVKGHAEPFRTK